jgi:hypothetical protein
VDLWFNPADFVAPPANTYGDSGRGILYGPGHTNFDTSLSKRFSVGGRANAEFRWDVFNLFNHPGFGFPNAAIGNPTVGTDLDDHRGQPEHAVGFEGQFLKRESRPTLALCTEDGVAALGGNRRCHSSSWRSD